MTVGNNEWKAGVAMSPHKVALHGQIEPDVFPEFVVVSEHLRSVMRTVQQISRFDANVLIYGESGTGKELLESDIVKKAFLGL